MIYFLLNNCNNLLTGLLVPTLVPVIIYSSLRQILSCHSLPFLLRKKIFHIANSPCMIWACFKSLVPSHTNCALTSNSTELPLAPCKSPRFICFFAFLPQGISPKIFPLFEKLSSYYFQQFDLKKPSGVSCNHFLQKAFSDSFRLELG